MSAVPIHVFEVRARTARPPVLPPSHRHLLVSFLKQDMPLDGAGSPSLKPSGLLGPSSWAGKDAEADEEQEGQRLFCSQPDPAVEQAGAGKPST